MRDGTSKNLPSQRLKAVSSTPLLESTIAECTLISPTESSLAFSMLSGTIETLGLEKSFKVVSRSFLDLIVPNFSLYPSKASKASSC